MPVPLTRLPPELAQQFFRFAIIGAVGFAVDVAVLYLALSWLGCGPYIARAVSYVAAASSTWYLNRRFTFADRRSDAVGGEWGRFVLLNCVGGIINYGAYAAFVHHFGAWGPLPALGDALGSLAGLIVNFTLSRRYVFRAPRPHSPRAQERFML